MTMAVTVAVTVTMAVEVAVTVAQGEVVVVGKAVVAVEEAEEMVEQAAI